MSLRVLITGGTTGIGLALAQKFLREGAKVAVTGRNREKFNAIKDTELIFYQGDVSDKEFMYKIVNDFSDRLGGLDIVIANAGIGYSVKSTLPNFEESQRIFDVNVAGVLNTFAPAVKLFHAQGYGHLVAISSIAGFNGLPGTSAYSASKAAVSTLMESYAIDLKKFKIDVTCIQPGFVDTPLTKRNKHPMPFLVTSEKAADKFYAAIIKKKTVYTYPYFFGAVVRFLSIIPRGLFIKLMSRKLLNYSKG